MKTLTALVFVCVTAVSAGGLDASQDPIPDSSVGSPRAHLQVHNIDPAHQITLGSGAKVGILGHSFDSEVHPHLYAGTVEFTEAGHGAVEPAEGHHGYWMALTVREVAPNAEIYALEIPLDEEERRSDALARALDWAAANHLDVVTYCAGSLSAREREALHPAVEEAVKRGLVVVFVDYYHPLNLLPASFGAPGPTPGRRPDLNIFSYDCTSLLGGRPSVLPEYDDDSIQRHKALLAQPSSGPFTAGLVALMRSVDPNASPERIKKILVETSRPIEYGGRRAIHAPDAFQAVTRMVGVAL